MHDITLAQLKSYEKKNIRNDEQLRRFLPYKYKDYSCAHTLKEIDFSNGNVDAAVYCTIDSVSKKTSASGKPMLVIKSHDREGTKLRAVYMNSVRLKPLFSSFIDKKTEILFMGPIQFDPQYGYSIFAPEFSSNPHEYLRVKPIYSALKGISQATLEGHMRYALTEKEPETIPDELRCDYPEINQAMQMLHKPNTIQEPEKGKVRLILDNLVYFKLMLQSEEADTISKFRLCSREMMDRMISSLPYSLTEDQMKTVNGMLQSAGKGRRLNALVQGDVGCGKTIVAFCMMVCAAENGYQSVLMAPTQILAEQHYRELKTLVPEDEVVFFDGHLKAKDRASMESKVKNGTAKYIVGTSALLTADITLKNIAVVIIDEEHRFGVEQRKALYSEEAHIVTMSATPIPRSLARTVYGEGMEIYQIKQKPAGRLPVITYYDNGKKEKNFLYAMLKKGGQAYIVCPLKDETDSDAMENVLSAEEIYKEYSSKFGDLGFRVGIVTGTTKNEEKEKILDSFKAGEVDILVSTTVIEVGVNVPNANIIIIKNAERFGLATLHQLRGRVGRGTRQSYCILVSDIPNSRICAMCTTNDGFLIAEEDLKERRSGDLLGIRQSGKNQFVEEALSFPEIEKDASEIISKMNYREALIHLRKYRKIYGC